METKSLVQFLVDAVPKFDEMIFQDMTKPYLHALRRDVRLLPNKLRKLWSESFSRNFRWAKLRKKRKATHHQIRVMLHEKVEQWINSLPKQRAIKERKIRTYSDFERGWLGKVETSPVESTQDRFRKVWPNVTQKRRLA